jgi:hypothetical protein
MRKQKEILIIAWAVITTVIVGLSGCAKDDTVTVGNSVLVTKTVSLTTDLVPLLTANCAKSGCHVKGSIAPDLEAGTAYDQLNSLGLISTSTPASSVIYQYMIGAKTPAMPLNGTANPGNINGYMLAWITQGAKNN